MNVINRIAERQGEVGRPRIVVCGIREAALSLIFLAKRANVTIDGVLLLSGAAGQAEAKETGCVPVFTASESPFPLREAMAVLALPRRHRAMVRHQLESVGCDRSFVMYDDDMKELSDEAARQNFIAGDIKTALKEHGLYSRVVVLGAGDKEQTIVAAAKMSTGGGTRGRVSRRAAA